jgi:hypothetical protein
MEKYVDRNFPHVGYAEISLFGKTKVVEVRMTKLAYEEPLEHYGSAETCHYVGRGEDFYASPHYKERNAVQVIREDFIRAKEV